MTNSSPRRRFIPDDEIIVVLDTSPIRNLAHATEAPGWVTIFSNMSKNGYSFSLADGTMMELMAQHQRGAISDPDFRRMLEWISAFLSKKAPMLPGSIDVLRMIGMAEEPWDERELAALAQSAWAVLSGAWSPAGPPPESLLDQGRKDWIESLDRVHMFRESSGMEIVEGDGEDLTIMNLMLDSTSDIEPPPSVRFHLRSRYRLRQQVRRGSKTAPYNPRSPQKRNDGIDEDLFQYLALPAFVVAEDKAFFGGLANIESFQKKWFIKPQELAQQWSEGKKPTPRWPSMLPSDV